MPSSPILSPLTSSEPPLLSLRGDGISEKEPLLLESLIPPIGLSLTPAPPLELDLSCGDDYDVSVEPDGVRPSNWKVQMIESAISDIENAEFVALDLGNN